MHKALAVSDTEHPPIIKNLIEKSIGTLFTVLKHLGVNVYILITMVLYHILAFLDNLKALILLNH